MAFPKFRPIPELSPNQLKSFESLIPKGSPEECWPWQGRIMPKRGYGTFCITGFGEVGAHRLAYKVALGIDPKELWVLHKCDNPPCCNPAHLFLGTYQDNVDDMVEKKRHMHGDSHYLRKNPRLGQFSSHAALKDSQVLEIKRLYSARQYTQEKLGEMFGVSEACIQKIVNGKNYAHLVP